jgi:alpha-galactosidase
LLADASQPADWRLARDNHYLDPSVPAVRAHVKQTIGQFRRWGYEMIKHDFSTYDLLGHWGFEMGAQPTADGWAFADRSRTTAEIIRQFYQDIRDAAGNHVLVEGCDTIGHLTAGLFELQRIGDDTSGREWDRTRKMGVNSLAFRAAQQGTFFVVDADCVGLATQGTITWDQNSQWMDLLARSGTGLFTSFRFNTLTAGQQAAVARAFAEASQPQPLAEPLDWMDRRIPAKWRLDGHEVGFSW